MRNRRWYALFLLVAVLLFAGCSKADESGTSWVTDGHEISSIEISQLSGTEEKQRTTIVEPEKIANIIGQFEAAEKTSNQSTNDKPLSDDIVKFNLVSSSGSVTVFVYQNNGDYFAERPYANISKLDENTFNNLYNMN